MEPQSTSQEKSHGGMIGAVIIVLIVIGLLIYLIPKKSDMTTETPVGGEIQTVPADTTTTTQSETEASIESDLNGFDSTNEDVNFDNLEF